MHTDAFTKLALLGFITMPLALGCSSDRGDGDPFTSGTAGQTNTSGSSDSGATSITTSDGTDSSSSGTDATTDDSSTTDDSDSGGTGIYFDVGDTGDATGNPTDGGSGEGCQYLDIVFIVDISGSMSEEKANLNANFPMFVQVLDDYVNDPNNGALGYRIGATNSSNTADGSTTGLDGALYLPTTGDTCGTMGQPWLDGPAAGLSDNFACLATNPRACGNSCSDLGKERPLDSMVLFTEKSGPGQVNDGFYRGDSSLLVIVTLTDEDDDESVSINSPASTKAALDAFAQGEERYVVVTVSGPEASGCNSAFGDAAPAPRLHEFTNSVPNSVMGNICDGDLTQALQEALATITASCDVLPPPQG